MHDVMKPHTRSSFTFISSEVSETLASNRNTKRMFGGADNRTSSSTSKTPSKIPETGFPAENNAQKSVEQSPSGAQDDRASALDSLRVFAVGELTKLYPSTSSLLGKEEEPSKKRALDDGTICFCASHAGKSTGERKTEEMMDYAIQNLSEAGKALANLGDNFEHDLRLMFMDIMGRVQHWVSVVQNRIHAARADLEFLRKESIARVSDQSAKDLELVAMRRKLDEAEANLAMERKQRLEIAPDLVGQESLAEQVSTSVQTVTEKSPVDEVEKLQSASAVTSVNKSCQCKNTREEETSREAELEAELAQLTEENERITKEHAEYERAIHCALLKGVSSLNIEALKVFQHSLIPCCAPCGLSSPRSSSPEPVVACRARSTKRDATPPQPVQRGSSAVSKCDKTKGKNGVTKPNCCQPLSEHLLHCSGGNEGSQENSILFLLHHGDAGNQYQPCVQARCRPSGNPSNKGSVCVGGKIRKPAVPSTKEKVSCVTRSFGSRPATYDLSARNGDDSGEICAARKNTPIAKRCGVCSGNRRNRDN